MKYVYMCGFQQSGGMWNSNGKAYLSYERALEEAKKYTGLRVFTIEIKED